jgi:hypothetical protein
MSIAQILRLAALGSLIAASTARAEPCEHRFGPQRDVGTVSWWDQQLSIAACEPLPRIRIGDRDQLVDAVAALERAAAHSISIYRAALAMAPEPQRLLAAYQLGQLQLAIVIRSRAAIAVPRTVDPEVTYHARSLHDALEPMLLGHLREAVHAFGTAHDIAEAIPAGVPADPVVRGIVAEVRERLDSIDCN